MSDIAMLFTCRFRLVSQMQRRERVTQEVEEGDVSGSDARYAARSRTACAAAGVARIVACRRLLEQPERDRAAGAL